jgi:hypothetical protein
MEDFVINLGQGAITPREAERLTSWAGGIPPPFGFMGMRDPLQDTNATISGIRCVVTRGDTQRATRVTTNIYELICKLVTLEKPVDVLIG